MNNEKSIKKELVSYGKKLREAGFVVGAGGNISIRWKNLIFLKAQGVDMLQAKESDYIAIDLKTAALVASCVVPSSEYRMHLACYRMRLDVSAVIHVHPIFSTAVSSKIKLLKSTDYEFTTSIKTGVKIVPFIQPGTARLAKAVGKVIAKDDVVILRNHGLVCVGRSLPEAFKNCEIVERASQIYILRKCLKG